MSNASVKTESSVLGDKVNEMSQHLLEGNPLDEWAWQTLLRDVVKLESIAEFRRESILLQAFVHSLKRDARKVESAFTKYVGLYGKDYPWHQNRAMVGIPLGKSEYVIDYLDYGYPVDDIDELHSVFDVSSQLGLMVSAEEAYNRLILAGAPDYKIYGPKINCEALAAAEFYRVNSVDEREVAKRVAKASNVVAEANGFLNRYSLHALSDGLLYVFTARGDVDQLVDLEMKIVEELQNAFEDDYSDYISFGVKSF